MYRKFDKAMITEVVDRYLGIPYKHKGRDLSGLDCYGLILAIKRSQGFQIADCYSPDYDENWSEQGKNLIIENYWKNWVEVKTPNYGDVVVFRTPIVSLNGTHIHAVNHAGIVLDDFRFIHASKIGITLGRLDSGSWNKRIEGFYKLKEEYEQ